MNYLIYGDQELLINKMANKIAKEELNELDEFNFVTYEANKTPMYEIVSDALTMPFMCDKKVIWVKNCYFLTSDNIKLEFEQSFDELNEYIDNENKETILIFSVVSSKLDDKKELVKKIKSKFKQEYIETIGKKDLPMYVRKMFNNQNVKIENNALEEFLNRCGDDMLLIQNEIDKLACYKREIDIKDIYLMIPKKIEDNVFEMIDSIFKKDMYKTFKIYYDLKLSNNEPLTLINLIASQVRFLYQVKVLKDNGGSEDSISKELNCHPYRVKLAIEKIYKLSKMDLTSLLEDLSNLDISIKSGEIDRFVGFELFLLNACS